MDHETIQKKFDKLDIKVFFREDNLLLWDKTLVKLNCFEHYQSNSYLNYQNKYLDKTCTELSFSAFKNNNPLFILPLFYNHKNDTFMNFEEYLFLPEINKSIDENIINLIIKLFKKKNIAIINPYKNKINKFIKINSCQFLNINLKNDINKIFSSFRKSYKNLINKKITDIKMNIYHKEKCSKDWLEFKELHKHVAGKVTRSSATWKIQEENIYNGNGLFICFKKNNQVISGSFFDLTKKDMKYSVSATHFDFFDNYCNHKSLYEAIKFGQKKNIKNIYLGNLKKNETDKKLINIFFFKKGFCYKSKNTNIYSII